MMLEHALKLAEKGFHVFPLVPNSKVPAIKDFPNKATRDQKQIEAWWEKNPEYNIGISTSRFREDENLVAIDVDNKGEKKGNEALFELEINGFEFPRTFEQATPTGGKHLVYRSSVAFKQGVNVLGNGLDIRARGGYLVGAGSRVEAGAYSADDSHIEEAPEWLRSRLHQTPVQRENSRETEVIEGVDQASAEARAIEYLKTAEVSVEGQGGNELAYKVACRVKDFGVGERECLCLMTDGWNDRCLPHWDPFELEKIVSNAYAYGTEPVGVSSPEADFKPVEETEEPKEKSYLQKLNDEYALVFVEGSHFVIHETVDAKGRPKKVFLTEQSFKRKFSPYRVEHNGKSQSYAHVWLDWKNRREYSGITFAPEKEAKHGYYNLWKGFTVKPLAPEKGTDEQRRGLQMILDHAKENICLGDEGHFLWLMGYFAHLIQRPFERPLTTLVFKGSKGTGKNAFVDRIGKLLGSECYLTAHDGRYLTSHFNGHLDSCLMLILDEAFWSGDKAAEGALKSITTAPELIIERKGKETYSVDNLVRLVVIGNENWLVPASHDERRYAVFEMGEAKKQNRKYFQTMRELLDDKGGNRLLLHWFQNFDLSAVDVNAAPKTMALLGQKLSSLDLLQEWWLACLQEGCIIHADFLEQWPQTVPRIQLREAFSRYTTARKSRGRIPGESLFGIELRKMAGIQASRPRDQGRRIYNYCLPTLETCRQEFEKFISHKIEWESTNENNTPHERTAC